MDEDRRREIGLFRYALVRDAADPVLSKAERGRTAPPWSSSWVPRWGSRTSTPPVASAACAAMSSAATVAPAASASRQYASGVPARTPAR